jgi:hypothetical protein
MPGAPGNANELASASASNTECRFIYEISSDCESRFARASGCAIHGREPASHRAGDRRHSGARKQAELNTRPSAIDIPMRRAEYARTPFE